MNTGEKVKNILSELSGEETVVNDAALQSDLALDSFLMVMLLIKIEELFCIQLDESDMNPFDLVSVQDVIDMVEKYRSGDVDE